MKTTFKSGVPTNTNYAITLGRKLERMLTDLGVICQYDESCYDGIRIRGYRHNDKIQEKVNTLIDVNASKTRPSVAYPDAIIISSNGMVLNTEITAEI